MKMDPTPRFFTKLRKLALTLESDTAKLQHTFENRNGDGDSETTARAMRAYHELNCEVGEIKGQIQNQLAQQKMHENEVNDFIKACRVMEQRVTKDIQTLGAYWEKYGYQVPRETKALTKDNGQESEAEAAAAAADSETMLAEEEEEEGGQEEAEDDQSSLLGAGAPPFADVLRTPQLSDFGLSEMQLKRAMAGAEWCSEVPPMPEMSLPHPVLNTPAPPPMPITPKRALRMDDDELQTPQMHDFGISEHTMCLNNDFTMDLLRKDIEKPQRPLQDQPAPPVNSLMESLQTKVENMESPEPPVFCTPGFKIKKTNGHCSPPAQSNGDPESPGRPGPLLNTPEVPAFQTPYVNRLVITKERSTKDPNKTGEHEKVTKEPRVNGLELDGPTQEFSLGTPCIRVDYQEPSTPEMPDLSSVTQDICKLVSQAQVKKIDVAVVHPNVRPEKDIIRAESLSLVSESEFRSLPSYLRQMTLYNLNQAIHNINKFTTDFQGEQTEFQMDALRRITNVGTKAPVYILCLTELRRLEHVAGARNNSLYKLLVHK